MICEPIREDLVRELADLTHAMPPWEPNSTDYRIAAPSTRPIDLG
jgi:hypothetical protein